MVTVKKQNIVREDVCCECATTGAPIHVEEPLYLLFTHTHPGWAPTVVSVFLGVRWNLNQLPPKTKRSEDAERQRAQR